MRAAGMRHRQVGPGKIRADRKERKTLTSASPYAKQSLKSSAPDGAPCQNDARPSSPHARPYRREKYLHAVVKRVSKNDPTAATESPAKADRIFAWRRRASTASENSPLDDWNEFEEADPFWREK